MSLDYYTSQKKKYDDLVTYLNQRRSDINATLQRINNVDVNSVNQAEDAIYGCPFEVFAEYADITGQSAKVVISNCNDTFEQLDTIISEAKTIAGKYDSLVAQEQERIRQEQERIRQEQEAEKRKKK